MKFAFSIISSFGKLRWNDNDISYLLLRGNEDEFLTNDPDNIVTPRFESISTVDFSESVAHSGRNIYLFRTLFTKSERESENEFEKIPL